MQTRGSLYPQRRNFSPSCHRRCQLVSKSRQRTAEQSRQWLRLPRIRDILVSRIIRGWSAQLNSAGIAMAATPQRLIVCS